MLSRREWLLSGVALSVVAAGASYSLSPLELIAQQDTKPIELPISWSDLWSDKKYFVKEPVYSNGIMFAQPVETENPNYAAELVYIAKEGDDKKLTDWTLVGSVYSKSDSEHAKPLFTIKSTGKVDSSNNLKMTDASVTGPNNLYDFIVPSFTNSVLKRLEVGNNLQVAAWIGDISGKYEALKATRRDLQPMP